VPSHKKLNKLMDRGTAANGGPPAASQPTTMKKPDTGRSGAKKKKKKAKAKSPKPKKKKGHPVDVVSGQVVDEALELVLRGPILVEWRRTYSSAFSDDRSPLGRGGWTHALHQSVDVVDGALTLRDEDGSELVLPPVPERHQPALVRGERLSVTRVEDDGFQIEDLDGGLTRIFAPFERGGPAVLREIRDAWGNQVDLVYAERRLTTVRAFGRELRLTYDAHGNIVRAAVWAESAEQQAVAYAYSKHGELVRATNALGHADHFEYDALHRMVKATLKNGVAFHYEYDDETELCVHTWGDGDLHDVELIYDLKAGTTVAADEEARTYTWNDKGALLKETNPDGDHVEEYTYDADLLVTSEANGAGEKWEYEYDERGNRVLVRDPAGNEMRFVYRGDVLVRRISPEGHVTSFTNNAQGAPIEVHAPTGLVYKLGFDGAGHVTYLYANEAMLRSYAYDEKQNLVKETDARGASTTYTYDPMGRPLTQTDALGRVWRVEYDTLGQPLVIHQPDGTRVSFAYDTMGNVVKEVDAMGRTSHMEYAGTGVLVRQTMPNGQTWQLAYDGMERIRTITNPKRETYEYDYDRAGRVVEERTFDKRTIKYQHSKAGRLHRMEYPDETWREFTHDPLGNVVVDDSPHGAHKFARDPMGRLLEAVVAEHSGKTVVKFVRDAWGRALEEIQNGQSVKSTYDARGRRVTRELPAGETTTYAYDRGGALVGLEHDGHEVTITRDQLGREVRRQSGKAIDVATAYDVMDRMESRIAKTAERPGEAAQRVLSERKWAYDANGRATRADDSRWGTTRYAYDELGQLIEAQRGRAHEVFYFDGAGSLNAIVEGLTARAVPWTVGEGNVLLQTEDGDIAYDARRRRVKETARDGKVTQYWWDCRDRLREVELPSGERALYTYDVFGRRVRKEIVPPEPASTLITSVEPQRVRVVTFLWDKDSLAQEIDTSRGKRVFVHGGLGSLLPILQQEQGEIFTYVVDRLGTARELLDGEGRVAWSAATSAWGTVTETWRDPASSPVESPFRMLGQYFDEETGFAYTRFRYFDAARARWISPDPLGIAGGANLNGFDGSPTADVDPLGLCVTTRMKALAKKAYDNVMKDPKGKLDEHLSDEEMDATKKKPFLKRCFFGTACERELDALVKADPELDGAVKVRTGPGSDYIGKDGTRYDLTTDNPATVAAHAARTGPNAIDQILTYPALTQAQLDALPFP
jgi:RHS repeat-associated protein